MRYRQFEKIISSTRMNRYLSACNGNTKKAMTLYRHNLRLSQNLFTAISYFEISLRNSIDSQCCLRFGNDWLIDSIASGGIFDNYNCRTTSASIIEALQKLDQKYSHGKLVAELGFGFWRYLFARHQYLATGRTLLRVFPCRPSSSPIAQFNHVYIYDQLAHVNRIRNRIAHHEPICFQPNSVIKSTFYARQQYAILCRLFQWKAIDKNALLYGLDQVLHTCERIDRL